MSIPEGKAAVSDGWKKSGIYDAITMGSNKFPVLDFQYVIYAHHLKK